MVPLLNIVNISTRKVFRKVWQFFNINYLYALLYPLLIKDFRHVGDCMATVAQIRKHFHVVKCGKCGLLRTSTPVSPITVTNAIAMSLMGMDPVTLFPARVTVLPSVQPFDPTSSLNMLKTNIGVETTGLVDLEGIVDTATTVSKASKFFSLG